MPTIQLHLPDSYKIPEGYLAEAEFRQVNNGEQFAGLNENAFTKWAACSKSCYRYLVLRKAKPPVHIPKAMKGFWVAEDPDGDRWIGASEPAWEHSRFMFSSCAWLYGNAYGPYADADWARKLGFIEWPDMSHLPPHERKMEL